MTDQTPAYDPNNIFAKILRGEMPSLKVFEDDKCIVLIDIMPRSDGHALVIPRAPSRNILDAAPEDLAHLIVIAQKVARAGKAAFKADGVTVAQFSEAAGGQVIFHTHIHVLPRHDGVELRPTGIRADDALLAEHARMLAAAIATAG